MKKLPTSEGARSRRAIREIRNRNVKLALCLVEEIKDLLRKLPDDQQAPVLHRIEEIKL